jgi:hypothetical protein
MVKSYSPIVPGVFCNRSGGENESVYSMMIAMTWACDCAAMAHNGALKPK